MLLRVYFQLKDRNILLFQISGDEKNGTYTLAQEFKLPYSSIVSSVQHLGGNIPYSSGRSKIFGEYDKDGNLIKIFRYDAQQFSYRVLKYNFKGFYFR